MRSVAPTSVFTCCQAGLLSSVDGASFPRWLRDGMDQVGWVLLVARSEEAVRGAGQVRRGQVWQSHVRWQGHFAAGTATGWRPPARRGRRAWRGDRARRQQGRAGSAKQHAAPDAQERATGYVTCM